MYVYVYVYTYICIIRIMYIYIYMIIYIIRIIHIYIYNQNHIYIYVMHIYIYVCIHTCMYVFRKRYAVQMVLLYKSAAVFPLLVIYFNFGSNGLPLFSVFSKREKDLNIHYIGGIIPLFHTCGGKLF